VKEKIAAGWITCSNCGKKFFKPEVCRIKKCDWCKTKHSFKNEEYIPIGQSEKSVRPKILGLVNE